MTAKLKENKNFLHLFVAVVLAAALVYLGFFLASNRVQADHDGDPFRTVCGVFASDVPENVCENASAQARSTYCGRTTETCYFLCGPGVSCCAPLPGFESVWFAGETDEYHTFNSFGTCDPALTNGFEGTSCNYLSSYCDWRETISVVSCECVGGGGAGTPPVVDLTASPTSVSIGGSSNLTWTVTGGVADDCNATGDWSGSKSTGGGSQPVTGINNNKTYTLTCTNADGSGSDSATVTIPAPTVNFSASPTSVVAGNTTNLTWSTTNATSCTASASPANAAWAGGKSLSGSQASSPIFSNTTFTLSCSGPGGTTSRNVVVTAITDPVPDVDVDITAVNGGVPASLSSIKDGDRLDFTVTFRNNPAAAPASNITGQIILSSNLTSPSNFSCVSCNGGTLTDSSFATYSWSGTLAPGSGSVQLRFSATVSLQTTQSYELLNVRTTGDYDPNNVTFDTNYSLLASPQGVTDPDFQEVAP